MKARDITDIPVIPAHLCNGIHMSEVVSCPLAMQPFEVLGGLCFALWTLVR